MASVTIPRGKQSITIFASSFVRDKKDLSITDSAKVEKIVDYSFERNDRANVLAIHPTKPLIAYLISIQRTPKISKAWSSSYDQQQQQQKSPEQTGDSNKNKTVSIRIIDYESRKRCLAKGIYHARPADCVFTINSTLCSQSDVIKLAIVDKLANVYLYDLAYFNDDLAAIRVAVIRGPSQDASPFDSINLVWCPFVPCEDFDDGDGGLRLALATDRRIEIFAVDRLQAKSGEMQRHDLKGAYKCINNAHQSNIVSMSISPDCSTISAAADDNGVKFFASDIDDNNQRCLHNWTASITDNSSISKLFFLDDYPKLLKDSTTQFWGSALIATKNGQMILIDLKTWSVYQSVTFIIETGPKNFAYRIDLSARSVIAINGNQAFVVQIDHDNSNSGKGIDNASNELVNGSPYSAKASPMNNTASAALNNSTTILPRIVKITRFGLHNPIYSFAVKHRSEDELELFTISGFSLEKFIINLSMMNDAEETPTVDEPRPNAATPHELKRFLEQFDGNLRISSSNTNNAQATNNTCNNSGNISKISTPTKASTVAATLQAGHSSMTPHQSIPIASPLVNHHVPSGLPGPSAPIEPIHTTINTNTTMSTNTSMQPAGLDQNHMDRLVEVLFNKLNTAFSQGLGEFLNDVKSEVNDLKLKLNVLCRDVRKLQQQLHEHRN